MTAPIASGGALLLGLTCWNGAYTEQFPGFIDSVRIHRAALSAAQIGLLDDEVPRFAAGVTGALTGAEQNVSGNLGVAYAGATGGHNPTLYASPNTFTVECWFRTTSTTGGHIIGFNSSQTAMSGTNSDRMVYLDSGGQLTYGVHDLGAKVLRSPGTTRYDDGRWHHVAASLGAAGMRLHVDGALVASGATTTAQPYSGYWRWGGSQLNGWSNAPASNALVGSIDEVAVYASQLSEQQVARHAFSNF